MKKITLYVYIAVAILFLSIACSTARKQQNSPLFLQVDTTNLMEEYAYIDSNNKIIVPYGKYSMCYTDTIKTIGFVMANPGCMAIDNKGNKLFRVYIVDNGNDYPSEGFFRILNNEGNKIGFADMNGNIIVSPRYDAALPFSEGMAAVGNGTQKVDVSGGEGRYVFIAGKWGFINEKGKEIIPLEYDSIARPRGFKDGKVKVFKNGQEFIIDKTVDSSTKRTF